jgi:hypothetical protein
VSDRSDLPEITDSVRPVLVTAPAGSVRLAAWTDGSDFYLIDGDVAELAQTLGNGQPRVSRRHRDGGWQIDTVDGPPAPLQAVMIGGRVHFAVGVLQLWAGTAARAHPARGET